MNWICGAIIFLLLTIHHMDECPIHISDLNKVQLIGHTNTDESSFYVAYQIITKCEVNKLIEKPFDLVYTRNNQVISFELISTQGSKIKTAAVNFVKLILWGNLTIPPNSIAMLPYQTRCCKKA